jgi:hypothetical protein
MLSRVLQEALDAIIDGADLSQPKIQELSSRLGKVITHRFTAGETDPEVLQRIALSHWSIVDRALETNVPLARDDQGTASNLWLHHRTSALIRFVVSCSAVPFRSS